MIRAIGWLIKVGVFAFLVLILGNAVKWRGRTVSDRIRTQVAHAERSELAGELKGDIQSMQVPMLERVPGPRARPGREDAPAEESIGSSERQKLRALIRELNSPEQ